MKLLLVSDLHRDGGKLTWLLDNAPAHDAILVAGDHLNIFSNTLFAEQQKGAHHWRNACIESGKKFAWCSGNHDFPQGDQTPVSSASPLWMSEKRENHIAGNFINDGESGLFSIAGEKLVVTTIPWPVSVGKVHVDGKTVAHLDFIKSLLHEGRRLREVNQALWVLLVHEPPAPSPIAADYVSPEAEFTRRILEAAEPDFSLHGHIHYAPAAFDGSWISKIGKTICFNAGQSEPGENPHFVLLNCSSSANWTATWSGNDTLQRATSTDF